MMIAFAIQRARTRNLIVKVLPKQLNRIYNTQKDIFSSTDVQIQALSIEHKPYKESVLESIDKDVSIFVRAAGFGMASTGCFYFAFSST